MKHWTRQISQDQFPRPITPLGWSLISIAIESTLSKLSKTLGLKKYNRNDVVIWHNFIIYTRRNLFSDFKNLKFDYHHLLNLFFKAFSTFFKVLKKSFVETGSFKNRFSNELFYKIYGNDISNLINGWPSQSLYLKKIMSRDYKLGEIPDLDYESFLKIRIQMQKDCESFFAEYFNIYFLKKLIFELLKLQLKNSGSSNEILGVLLSQKETHRNWDIFNPISDEVESSKGPHIPHSEIIKTLAWNPKAEELIEWLQKLIQMEKDLSPHISKQFPQIKVLMSKIEETAAWKELIIKKDSIYFLHLNEIEYGLKKSNFHLYFDLIHERRNAYLSALNSTPPTDLIETMTGAFKTEM